MGEKSQDGTFDECVCEENVVLVVLFTFEIFCDSIRYNA